MKQRKLGCLQVSEIGLGCMGMDHAYGTTAPRKDMVKLLHRAVELGCTFFDTAVVYGTTNEELLGQAFSSMRDKVVLATKFGIVGQRIENGKPVNLLDSRPESIRVQVEGSLNRLKTDHIDLYYQHRTDPSVEPETVADTMSTLIKEGKILAWGLSNASVEYMKRAHAVCPLAAVENQYSMMWREPEHELFDLCSAMGLAFVAYSPLGNGFLTGRFTRNSVYEEGDFRSFMGRFNHNVMEHNQCLLKLIQDTALAKQATPAQIVLAWELAQRPFIIPIPGTTCPQRLEENLGASLINLSNEELAAINASLASLDVDETYF